MPCRHAVFATALAGGAMIVCCAAPYATRVYYTLFARYMPLMLLRFTRCRHGLHALCALFIAAFFFCYASYILLMPCYYYAATCHLLMPLLLIMPCHAAMMFTRVYAAMRCAFSLIRHYAITPFHAFAPYVCRCRAMLLRAITRVAAAAILRYAAIITLMPVITCFFRCCSLDTHTRLFNTIVTMITQHTDEPSHRHRHNILPARRLLLSRLLSVADMLFFHITLPLLY